MRHDGGLGACRNFCGRMAQYRSTGECAACYKARRKAGKAAPVADLPRKTYTFQEKRAMGRDAKRRVMAEGRAAFLQDSEYAVAIVEAYRTQQNRSEAGKRR